MGTRVVITYWMGRPSNITAYSRVWASPKDEQDESKILDGYPPNKKFVVHLYTPLMLLMTNL